MIQIIRCWQNRWEKWNHESQGKLLLDLILTPNFQRTRTQKKLPPVITTPHHRGAWLIRMPWVCQSPCYFFFCCQRSCSITSTSFPPSKQLLNSSYQCLTWNSASKVRYKEVHWRIWECCWVENSRMGKSIPLAILHFYTSFRAYWPSKL